MVSDPMERLNSTVNFKITVKDMQRLIAKARMEHLVLSALARKVLLDYLAREEETDTKDSALQKTECVVA